jgi:hypothetical protein
MTVLTDGGLLMMRVGGGLFLEGASMLLRHSRVQGATKLQVLLRTMLDPLQL